MKNLEYSKKYYDNKLISFTFNLKQNNKGKKEFHNMPQFSKINKENYMSFIKEEHNSMAIRLGEYDETYCIILLDIDYKEGDEKVLNGIIKWKELIKNKKIKTMTQKTGNNGLHYLFKIDKKRYEKLPSMITSLNIEGRKYSIDFKGKNQFVIVEPTKYEEKTYKWNNIDIEIETVPDWIYDLLCNNKKINNKKINNNKIIKNEIYEKISLEDLENYVSYLNKSRSNNYGDWIEVGICLNNINTNSLGIWIDFSKKSNKFRLGECEEKWKTFEYSEKSWIGVLHKWIEEDNKNNYNEIKKLITTQKIINKNKFEGHDNKMKVEELTERRDHNVVWFKDCQENISQLSDEDNMIIKMYPEKMSLIKKNIICKEKDLIIRKHELNDMFSLTQINNYYNNIIINNYNTINTNENINLEKENVFDDDILNNLIYSCINICTANYFAKLIYHKCKNKIVFNKKNGWYIFNEKWKKLENLRDMITNEFEPLFEKLENYYDNNDKAFIKIKKTMRWMNDTRNKTDIIFELENNYDDNFIFNENKNLISFNNGVYDLENMIFREKKGDDKITYSTNYDYINEYTNNYDKLVILLNKIQPEKKYLEYMIDYLSLCLGNNDKVITALEGKTNKIKNKFIELIKISFGDYFIECEEKFDDINKKIVIIKTNDINLKKTYYDLIKNNKINIIIECEKFPKLKESQLEINNKLRTLNLSIKNEIYEENINNFQQDFMLLLIKNYKKLRKNNFILIPNTKNLLWISDVDIYIKFLNEKTIICDTNVKTGVLYECFINWVKQYMTKEIIPNQRQFVYKIKKYKQITEFKFEGKTTTGIKNIKII